MTTKIDQLWIKSDNNFKTKTKIKKISKLIVGSNVKSSRLLRILQNFDLGKRFYESQSGEHLCLIAPLNQFLLNIWVLSWNFKRHKSAQFVKAFSFMKLQILLLEWRHDEVRVSAFLTFTKPVSTEFSWRRNRYHRCGLLQH